jgi:catechol 2,3-dioxygenase-like lactoylglutathione lyase family enzyme
MTNLTQEAPSSDASTASITKLDQKIEVTIFPVADVDRAKEFYLKLGWRLDADFKFPSFRVVQVTPPGSSCSLQFGSNMTSAAPGSGKGYIVVSDIVEARNALIDAGVQVGDFVHLTTNGLTPGLDPERSTYRSRAEFKDLVSALKRAALAHGQHEARIGQRDENWPAWYAEYMVREQSGQELPQ